MHSLQSNVARVALRIPESTRRRRRSTAPTATAAAMASLKLPQEIKAVLCVACLQRQAFESQRLCCSSGSTLTAR